VSREERPPYFPFYPNDFACDGVVEAMTTEEVGAYILLLCKAWREEPVGSIPSTDGVLARWARLTPDRWEACKPAVLRAFTLRADSRLYQKRLEQEWQKLRGFARKKSQAGKAGANARWNRVRKANEENELDTTAMRPHSDRTADAMTNDSYSPSPPPSKNPPNPPAGGAGVSSKRVGGGRVGPLERVTVEELRDTGQLRERIRILTEAGLLPNTENDRLMAVAAAERALAKGDNPPALWVNLVRNKRWGLLSGEEVEQARKRIDEWLKSRRTAPDRSVTDAINRVAGTSQGSEEPHAGN
jgi:uncharacterized protein YdaU (DUF1376 family)